MKTFLTLMLSLLLLGSQCKTEPPVPTCKTHYETTTLPPVTACGADNFGCILNEEVWVPFIAEHKPGVKRVHADWYDGKFILSASRNAGNEAKEESIIFHFDSGIFGTGNYLLNNQPGKVVYSNWEKNCFTNSSSDYTGNLTISKFDRDNFIIAGTFEFTIIENGCDTIRVTQGRFDVRE